MSKKLFICLMLSLPLVSLAQTDMDAIMMEKNAFCVGPMYGYSSWKDYWEGNLKRNNLNLGKVSTQTYGLMGSYGLTKKLNLLFNAPYMTTKASQGTLHGQKGFQDLSLFVKYAAARQRMGDAVFTLFTIAGILTPLSNYVADIQPLAIGMHSTNGIFRLMGDIQKNKFFVTASATYVVRSNIKIDRNTYYTTELHNTNKVDMPDLATFNVRAGLRSYHLIAEAVFNSMHTLGGYDITRNNAPFPSNKMDATTAGVNFKYTPAFAPKLSLVAGSNYVIAGRGLFAPRNVGQSLSFDGALFYVFDFSRKSKTDTNNNQTK